MDITNNYIVSEKNYIPELSQKNRIILGHTFNHGMRHVGGWLNRSSGEYKKTAHFTIGADGRIHKHFNPKFYSNFFDSDKLNMNSIIVLLENDGWLIRDNEKNRFITLIGDIYNESNGVFEKRWRGFTHWAPYSSEQLDSATALIRSLCDEFNIPKAVIGHNTKIDQITNFMGVMYKSNLDKKYTDLNPSWDFLKFKTNIEENTTKI